MLNDFLLEKILFTKINQLFLEFAFVIDLSILTKANAFISTLFNP